MPMNQNMKNQIYQHEASSLEEKYKDTKVSKKTWKKDKIFGIIIIVVLVSMFLSIII